MEKNERIKKIRAKDIDIKLLDAALRKSWSKETCYPPMQKGWSPRNPAFGQCAVTALIIQDYFDGELLYCKHFNHYWNRLPDNSEIDLTHQQFSKNTYICFDEMKTRNYVLKSEFAKKMHTLRRYKLLKELLKKRLNIY